MTADVPGFITMKEDQLGCFRSDGGSNPTTFLAELEVKMTTRVIPC